MGRFHALLEAKKSDEEILTDLYLAAYCRRPEPDELDANVKYLKSSEDRVKAFEDVLWVLLNSNEFLFQH